MSEELNLVTELAVILIAAGVFTVISKALKQPLILGYIVAGFVVGPHLGLIPQFSPESVHQWSEIGIIFLLFGLGLEFNFKKLLGVGSTAVVSALTICLGMFLTGFIAGTAMGWTPMERIFLGGMLGMSSTTIIIKAYDDLGYKDKPYSSLVFGLLVVEDLLAVLMMVLFSTIAVSNKFSGVDMLKSLAKLVVFLVSFFLVGIYVIPSLFKRAQKYITDEILLLISVGLCFLLVFFANRAGFSSALGAFLMGSILSSTIEGERIEKLTGNIKNLFGAVFFVSVGMMVDPSVIGQHYGVIIAITIVAMLGILTFATAGVLLAGKNLDTALHVGFSLPQLGEFSFIIAALGTSLGVVSDFIYPVIISVSVITTFTTPYMIKAADPVSSLLYAKLPPGVIESLDRRSKVGNDAQGVETPLWKAFATKYFIRLGIYAMILLVLLLGLKAYLPVLADKLLPGVPALWVSLIEVVVSLVIMAPFLYGTVVNTDEIRTISGKIVRKDPRARIPLIIAFCLKIFLAVEFALSAIIYFVHLPNWSTALIFASLAVIFLITCLARKRHNRIEARFFANLNAKEEYARQNAPVASTLKSKLSRYDIHTKMVTVLPNFLFAGEPLRNMPFRKTSGVNIAKIQRGAKNIFVPSGDERIYPSDKLLAVGTSEQLEKFEQLMAGSYEQVKASDEEFAVEAITLDRDSSLTGMTLKDSYLRSLGCLVVSVERNQTIIANPHKDFKFIEGDKVWIAGLKSSLESLH